ncbi:uncharacterized protein LOC119783362 isoform X1 [Cyprinodon tularosa]|uniref:uncharacterized protein LOC119783362 isoform X1 n=1 Tax=Cyprinodon tularosa TaxID=77115 RepID=UPI0018E2582A|nr:uncharacterized protein LOC119783362 isoform X1 [Cyprinodon tularosa]XP_038140775.1 uncharacterized protein LOC119783362 isoform X1 [Cyprinodon tularosa]XP_038140776.1 uncharacterized protein LOC119783362 isoform X1 [Cyprinodon tularosa]
MGPHQRQPSAPLRKIKQLLGSSLLITVLLIVVFSGTYRIQTTKHSAPQRDEASFIAVKMTKTLLISAYLEHRSNKREVRVIAIVRREEKVSYRCIFQCQNQQWYISKGVLSIHTDHFGFSYGTADIMCPIPPECENPSHISVASDKTISEDEYKEEFLEVNNQKAQTESFPYNFTVCISTMFDFTNVLQLVQSFEMLQLLGVNKVFVYKTNCSRETQSVLDYYSNKKGFVEVIPWSMSRFLNVSRGWQPKHGPGDLHYFGQIPALNDCLYRNMYKSKYVALHDIDELILPQTVKSWMELLPLLEKKYSPKKCYKFQNNVFPNNVSLPSPKDQNLPKMDHWKGVPGVNILAHLHQEPITKEMQHFKFKVIINPRDVYWVSVHDVLKSDHGCSWVDRNMARMYHTRDQMQPLLTSDKMIHDGRLLSYSAPLSLAVDTALQESGLLSKGSKNLN